MTDDQSTTHRTQDLSENDKFNLILIRLDSLAARLTALEAKIDETVKGHAGEGAPGPRQAKQSPEAQLVRKADGGKVSDCAQCHGAGAVTCQGCKGSGQHFSSDATGSFAEHCENCLGVGTISCPVCGRADHTDFIEALTEKLAQINYSAGDAKAAAEKAEADHRDKIDWALEDSETFYFEVNDSAFEASFTPDGVASLTRVRGSL